MPLEIDVSSVRYTPVDVNVYIYAWAVEGGPVDDWDWWNFDGLSHGTIYEAPAWSDVQVWSSSPAWYCVDVNAHGVNGDASGDCDVCVFAVDIQDEPPNRDTAEYIAYQTGTTIYYKIEPTSDWSPASVTLYIKDGATAIRTEDITAKGIGEKSFDWDGKKDDGITWAEPNQYTAEIKVEKWLKSHSDTHPITVVQVDINAGLSEQEELEPGKYINVNWGDDDDDGWQPNDNPPGGTYTGDKDDPNIDGGDNDFRSFIVSISPQQTIVEDFPNSKVSITFPSNVKVWQTNTKKTVLGESSELTSGAQFVVENLPKELYLEGVSGSSTFKDAELKATWLPKSFSDIVKVTVFEVDLVGLFDYDNQQDDNDKKHSTFGGSSDKNGKISWDDANADGIKGDNDPNCEYFSNCMECQGVVMPSGVTNEVVFDIKRDEWVKVWKKLDGASWIEHENWTPWQDDDGTNNDEDLTPSGANHIYSIDGPGFAAKERTATYDYLALIGNFREWVMVEIDSTWYQCSDYSKWHTKLYTEPKDDDYMTRDSWGLQLSGDGWITVPDSP